MTSKPSAPSIKLADRLIAVATKEVRVVTVFDGLLCKLAEGFLSSTPRANPAVRGPPPGLTPV
jgi:hypothetical protein